MSEVPRYAFVTLEPGMTEEEAYENLSLYGDVRVMSRISELSALLTEMVENLEKSGAKPFQCVPVVPASPAKEMRGVTSRHPTSPPRKTARRSIISPSNDRVQPQPVLKLPTFGSTRLADDGDAAICGEYSQSSMLQRTAKEIDEEAMVGDIKSELLEDDVEPLALGLIKEDSPLLLDYSRDGEMERQYEQDDDEDEQPCSSSSFNNGLSDDADTGMNGDLRQFMDEEGMIEVPYSPDFAECRPRRAQPSSTANQAQCDVCKRWVRTTNTLSRLIAHVFMHAQKQRFVCPHEGCEYSNKTEPITRRHILSAHGSRMDPIDIQNDKKRHSESWKADRGKWAPRCFPEHFETAAGGDIFARVNDKSILMSNQF